MFKKDKPYSRIEIEQIINEKREDAAQGSYYSIINNEGESIGISFLNKVSIYNNELIDKSNLFWQDSTGKKTKSGEEFLSNDCMFFFKEFSANPKKYVLIGEVEKFTTIEFGEKWITPNTFKITLKEEVSHLVLELFESEKVIQEREQLINDEVNRVFGVTDPAKASAIGKRGEELFKEKFVEQNVQLFEKLKAKISDMNSNEFIWVNEKQESYKPYDFKISGEKIDVKTTTTSLNDFYISEKEKQLLENGELLIAIVHIDKGYNFLDCLILDKNDIIENYKFTALKYYAKEI